ncbi:MAG: S8 family peptidase [Anaerolineae bacterium]
MMRVLTVLTILASFLTLAYPAPVYAGEPVRVLVRFQPGAKAAVMNALDRDGGQVHYEFDDLSTIAVTLPAQAIDGLSHNPNVVLIETDEPIYPADQTTPYGIDSVEARDVWDADRDGVVDPGAPTGAGRTVCVIDSGVTASHEDFTGVNFVGGYPADWNVDACGHGTHVTGIVAAMNNTSGVVGVSPGAVSIYVVKVFGDDCRWSYTSTLIDAVDHCQNAGANIVNMSLVSGNYSSFGETAFQNFFDQGLLMVASAGNGGGTDYAYPASFNGVISVAAVDANNVVPWWSRRNDRVELTAPGVDVLSTYNNGGYTTMGGTSMATPHVTAAAAVVWSADPTLSNLEIRQALQDTALDLGAAGRDDEYGFGVVKTLCALHAIKPMPTSVQLARFEATGQRATITVDWETASETDNVGFNLYRSESADGPRTRLNGALIPSQAPGSLGGATYQYVDEETQSGIVYYYWLESIDVSGGTAEYGPASAKLALPRLLPSQPRTKP